MLEYILDDFVQQYAADPPCVPDLRDLKISVHVIEAVEDHVGVGFGV